MPIKQFEPVPCTFYPVYREAIRNKLIIGRLWRSDEMPEVGDSFKFIEYRNIYIPDYPERLTEARFLCAEDR